MVGYTLRQERERQNLSVEDVEQGTSIRTSYINAIENGEYDKLPGNVYTKGFIKSYAKFLGVDEDAMAKEFAADIAEIESTNAPPPLEDESAKVSDKTFEVKPAIPPRQEKKQLSRSAQQEERNLPSIPILAAGVVIVLLAIVGAWSLISGAGGEVAKVETPVQQEQTAKPEPTPADTSTPVASANPAPPNDNVAIQARFNDRCWVLVTIDGAVVQEGVVDGGQTLSWEGKNDITFRLGNAGAVEFFQNGQSIGVLGGIGEIADKTFTRS